MIVYNIISFVCGLPWGKTEFWIMLENFGFEWIFLEPTRWKWLNMEILKWSFSNWLLPDKELRGNREIEGENDQRISAFAKCKVKLSCCQYYFPTLPRPRQTINQLIKLIKVSEKWRDYINKYHLGSWSSQPEDQKTSGASAYTKSRLVNKTYNFWLQFAWIWWFQPWDWSCIVAWWWTVMSSCDHLHHYLPPHTNTNTTLENRPREQHTYFCPQSSVYDMYYVVQARSEQVRNIPLLQDKTVN